MHITSDGLKHIEAIDIIRNRGITMVIRAKPDNYIELYTDHGKDNSKRVGEIKPSERCDGMFLLTCDLPPVPYKKTKVRHFDFSDWDPSYKKPKVRHFSYSGDFAQGELGLLL